MTMAWESLKKRKAQYHASRFCGSRFWIKKKKKILDSDQGDFEMWIWGVG